MTQPDPGQFDLVPVVFEAYRPRLPMPGAEAEAEAIADALADFRARPVLWESGPRNYPATTVRLRDWEQRASRNSMLLWIGHGFSRQDEGSLYVPGEPRPDGLPEMDDELGPAAFADHLIRQAGHRQVSGSWAIVVIEACGAGRYVDLVHQHLNARNRTEGLLLVGSGNASGDGHLGRFRQVLDRVYGDGSGLRLTTNDTEITLQRFGLLIKGGLGSGGQVYIPHGGGQAPPTDAGLTADGSPDHGARRVRAAAPSRRCGGRADRAGRRVGRLRLRPRRDRGGLRRPGERPGDVAGLAEQQRTRPADRHRTTRVRQVRTHQPGRPGQPDLRSPPRARSRRRSDRCQPGRLRSAERHRPGRAGTPAGGAAQGRAGDRHGVDAHRPAQSAHRPESPRRGHAHSDGRSRRGGRPPSGGGTADRHRADRRAPRGRHPSHGAGPARGHGATGGAGARTPAPGPARAPS